jgi:prepilin-type N-terminal cleavage/methylation domain-containing protein
MRRDPQSGFTLTEMMVVVVILGVLAALSYNLISPHVDPVDTAERTSMLMRETARRASEGGPVRADVVTALGLAPKPPRARLHVVAGSPRVIAVEVLVEDPLPAHTATWAQVQTMMVPSEVTLKGWRQTSDLTGGVGPAVALNAADQVVVQCYTNSTCDPATLYFDVGGGDTTNPARVVLMPLGGAPVTYDSW